MSKIRVLPSETANRIAAGEVVERPASVVKELVENSIDAEAERIVVRIENGGRKSIQVTDDGCGMDGDDALLALEAHATSKIGDGFDIDRIHTLGFRGEALPSIAGVSRFRLQTRPAEAAAGCEVVVEGGVIREVRECGCPPGTAVTVRNLFYNLPARRKFLRAASTEQGHIQEIVLLQALARPEIGFELWIDGQAALRAPAGRDRRTRLAMLLGRQTAEAMLEVEHGEDGVSVSGYIARPGLTRSNRREQRMFVNGRPASADPLFFAVRDAYHTLVMKGRYPPVVLYLELPAEEVDVNVHPTKREVRFRDGLRVGRMVGAALRKALRGLTGEMVGRARRPSPFSPPVEVPRQPGFEEAPGGGGRVDVAAVWPSERSAETATEGGAVEFEPGSGDRAEAPADFDSADLSSGRTGSSTSPSVASPDLIRRLRVIGTLRHLYLVAESDSGLVLIDHHAAHERILYEKLLRAASARRERTQPLLMPVSLDFSPADAALLERNLEAFRGLGFQIEPFGGGSFIVGGVPASLRRENIEGLMRDLFEELRATGTTGAARLDQERLAQAACKQAVRAEDRLDQAEIERLLADLAATEMPYTCPHGRPVMINLSYSEIERRFGRRT